uniref:Uncharacterized protein n=1 Tax=Rhizophora mucronata TaxID=61149 RepID=A0A2P2PHG1_RHIMU
MKKRKEKGAVYVCVCVSLLLHPSISNEIF